MYAALVYRNPRSIFLKLLDEYTANARDVNHIYVLKIVSIAAVTGDELRRTSGLLKDHLIKTRGEQISRLTIVELEKALDSCPSVIDHFKFQLVNQMPSAEKLELLCALENESLVTFIEASKAIGVKRMHAFKMRRLLRCFDAWRMEVEFVHKQTKRRKITTLSAWKKEAQRLQTARMLEEVALISFYKALLRRNFTKWRRLVEVKNRIQRVCLSENIDKEARQASGHLRIFAMKLNRRLAYSAWISFTIMERRYEDATHLRERKTGRLAFHALHVHSRVEIQKRKIIREASIIKQRKSQQRQQQSLELDRNRNRKSPKWASNSRISQAKSQTRQLSQNDIMILAAQREMRRKRVDHTKREMEKALHSKWLAKQSEFEASGMRRIEAWTTTSDYKNLFEDQEKKYKRILSDAIDRDAESALTSDEVISYSILDGLVTDALVDPEFLFKSLPDPFDIVAFKRALKGLNLNTKVEKVFIGIAGQSKSMTKGRLRELQRLSHQHVGAQGSMWKIYVISGRIQLHNISSGQTIAEIKKKHIRQVIRENLRSCEMLKLRRTFSEMKQQAYRSMCDQHAAKKIQFMFRQWKGRLLVTSKLWIVNRLRLKTKEKEAKAAIQKGNRARRKRE